MIERSVSAGEGRCTSESSKPATEVSWNRRSVLKGIVAIAGAPILNERCRKSKETHRYRPGEQRCHKGGKREVLFRLCWMSHHARTERAW